MGLFGNKNTDPTPATHGATTTHPRHSTSSTDGSRERRGFFNKRSDPSPQYTDNSNGLSHAGSKRSSGGGLFNRHHNEDPSILDARQRIASAEAAERDADRALMQARTAVRDAKEHVKRLEREAAEEARLAKIKQQSAKDIGKRAKPLGRHDHY
ncbi:hypothetical protein LTR67_003082 [Exophiala xenobiotica]